jgi:hypothetical protein
LTAIRHVFRRDQELVTLMVDREAGSGTLRPDQVDRALIGVRGNHKAMVGNRTKVGWVS